MDPKEAVEIIWKDEIAQAAKPDEVREKKYKELLKTYIDYPFHAAEYLMVDEIVNPKDTRPELIKRLEVLAHKEAEPRPWRKHVLMPR